MPTGEIMPALLMSTAFPKRFPESRFSTRSKAPSGARIAEIDFQLRTARDRPVRRAPERDDLVVGVLGDPFDQRLAQATGVAGDDIEVHGCRHAKEIGRQVRQVGGA
jgi:hypothetical protein